MEEVCPDAWFLNYTNPMAILSGYMQRYTKVKTVGLCHSVQVCGESLLRSLGMEDKLEGRKELLAGINHMCWLLTLQDKNGNDLPSNMVRAYTATPITAAGTYTMFIFDVYPMGSWEGLNETYVFTFNGSSITSGIEEVKGENGNAKTIYDLTGRRVETITKPGIYIVGGKKVLVK